VLRRADGLVLGSPAYHGGISGLVKNALDYVEDMADDRRVYLDGMAVGCIGAGAGWQGAHATLAALRNVTHSLRGWPTPLGIALNTVEPAFDLEGHCVKPALEAQAEALARQILGFATQDETLVRGVRPRDCSRAERAMPFAMPTAA
jgi:FMN reductase